MKIHYLIFGLITLFQIKTAQTKAVLFPEYMQNLIYCGKAKDTCQSEEHLEKVFKIGIGEIFRISFAMSEEDLKKNMGNKLFAKDIPNFLKSLDEIETRSTIKGTILDLEENVGQKSPPTELRYRKIFTFKANKEGTGNIIFKNSKGEDISINISAIKKIKCCSGEVNLNQEFQINLEGGGFVRPEYAASIKLYKKDIDQNFESLDIPKNSALETEIFGTIEQQNSYETDPDLPKKADLPDYKVFSFKALKSGEGTINFTKEFAFKEKQPEIISLKINVIEPIEINKKDL